MNYLYKTIQEHNPNKKRKILIAFNNMIADILIRNLASMFPKMLNKILCTILLWKFQAKRKFKEFRLIIHQIFTFKTS